MIPCPCMADCARETAIEALLKIDVLARVEKQAGPCVCAFQKRADNATGFRTDLVAERERERERERDDRA